MANIEVIVVRESVLESIAKDAVTFALFVSLIGVGVLLESGAMQWVGAIIGFTTIAAVTVRKFNQGKLTIEQARAKLDEIEARA